MKSFAALILACAGAGTAVAAPPAELARDRDCLSCHAVDKKVVGPAFKEVAAKYAGQKDAVDKLTQKVMKGSQGVWGPVPMPANPQVTEAEAKQLVEWVLSQK